MQTNNPLFRFNLNIFKKDLNKLFPLQQSFDLKIFEKHMKLTNTTDPNELNIIKILGLFIKFWNSEKHFLQPVQFTSNKIETTENTAFSKIKTLIDKVQSDNTEPKETIVLNDLISNHDVSRDDIHTKLDAIRDLIMRKLSNDPLALCYGSFSAYVMNGMNKNTDKFKDIDFYSSTAYRFLVVLMVLCSVVYGLNSRIFSYPYMIGHMGFVILNSDNKAIDICDCIDLSSDIMTYIPKIVCNKINILHPSVQIYRYVLAVLSRPMTNNQYTKYIKNALLFSQYIDSIKPKKSMASMNDLISRIGFPFYTINIEDNHPIFVMNSDLLNTKRTKIFYLEEIVDKMIYGHMKSMLFNSGYKVYKSRQFGMYYNTFVYEIRNNMLCGLILVPYPYTLYTIDNRLSMNSEAVVMILTHLYYQVRIDRGTKEFTMEEYIQGLNNSRHSLDGIINKIVNNKIEVVNGKYIEHRRFKATGNHKTISIYNSTFSTIITLNQQSSEFTLLYNGVQTKRIKSSIDKDNFETG